MEKIAGWLRIDPHVHSSGASFCSKVTCEEIVDAKIGLSYDGVVLTNHCQPWYYQPEEHKEWARKFIAEYERGRQYARSKGFRFFLGIEVSVSLPAYSDWLLYGVTEKFLKEADCLYQLDQRTLFALCRAYNVVMVQAHPLRQQLLDTRYMHGIEINCTPGDLEKRATIEHLANDYDLMVTCGTDYHSEDRVYRGGILIPDTVTDSEELATYFRSTDKTRIFTGDRLEEYPVFPALWQKKA